MQSSKKKIIEEKINKYDKLTNDIEGFIERNELENASKLIDEFTQEIQNSTTYSYKAILEFQKGRAKDAIDLLIEGVREHPFSFNLHFNLGFIYFATENYDKALECYLFAVKYSQTKEEKKAAHDGVKETSQEAIRAGHHTTVIQEKLKNTEKLLHQMDARVYPIDINGLSLIRKPQRQNISEEYMINMYKELKYANVDLNSRMLFKSELVKGSVLSDYRKWVTTGPVVIPISKIAHPTTITFVVNGNEFTFKEDALSINQYHYIRITDPGTIELSVNSDVFVGNPIELEPESKPVKLVLKIFVDGLSYQFLEDSGLEKAMPNTYQFFKKGFLSENCYTTSEWTLPSKSSINTGLYATKHKMLHPEYYHTYSENHKLLAEYFKAEGYYCTNISTNWRTTPNLGYYRGFDRMIYQNYLGGMDSKEVVMETIEHLLTFDKTNNFMAISLMDLHDVPDEIESHLYSQVNTDIKDRIYRNKMGSTSVQTKYDSSKVAKYLGEIKRIDNVLSILYDFIIRNFKEDQFVIALHSDHGQSFLQKEFNLLSDSRLKIPFMIRGGNVPAHEGKELMESVDILPSILHCSELEIPASIDGRVPKALGGDLERTHIMTQIIHPGQTYKALIKDNVNSFLFESKEKVLNDLTFDIKGYSTRLINGHTINKSEKSLYEKLIFENIKNFIRWSTS